ncbi:MAG: hypothetical protein JRG80_06145 [Deltaproteobacteria bacterium]|nr:hypothetical protein [Deltaproteobacteria bacterium]MBW2398837.1 hypothetical protein [Deltaproteobacteria bacterium]
MGIVNSTGSLLHLIDLAYETAIRPTAWQQFLDALVETLDLRGANLIVRPHIDDGSQGLISANTGVDAAAVLAYQEHFASVEPWVAAGVLDLPAGDVSEGASHVPTRRVRSFARPGSRKLLKRLPDRA